MQLSYEKFEDILKKYKRADEFSSAVCKLKVSPEFFDDFYAVIETLMDSTFSMYYTESGIEYIIYEWIYNNKSPVKVTNKDGTVTEYPLDTIRQVYDVMEEFHKKPANSKESKKKAKSSDLGYKDFFNNIFGKGTF